MSDFYNPPTKPTARKEHRCIGCYSQIARGETYHHQTGVYDGHWFVNKLHHECADAMAAESDGGWYEFTPGELDPPPRAAAAIGA